MAQQQRVAPLQGATPVSRSWTTRRDEKRRRMQLVQSQMQGPILPRERLIEALEALIVSGDRVVLEGDNQKQADFLSRSLVKVDAGSCRHSQAQHYNTDSIINAHVDHHFMTQPLMPDLGISEVGR